MLSPEPSSSSPAPGQRGLQLQIGTVCGQAGEWLFVRDAAGGEQRALAAPSCLLAPELGDTVLLCQLPEPPANALRAQAVPTLPGRLQVLAVLARAAPDAGTVQLPGQVRLNACDGALRVAGRSIELAAPEGIRARTAQFGLDALRADLRLGHLDAHAGRVHAGVGELQLIARNVRQTVGRLIQKARDSFRTVEGLDDLRAGRSRWEIEGHARLHAKQATVLAEGAVKIDGARIDLG